MNRLLELLPILNVGSSKHDFPVYAPYMHSAGSEVYTCNGSVFVKVDCNMLFTGDTNIHVLSSILNKASEPEISVDDNYIYITSSGFRTKLNIVDVNFPIIDEPEIDSIEVTEDLLDKLKLASRFVGSAMYAYVFIGNGYIASSDKERVFLTRYETGDEPIGVDTKITSFLQEGYELGVAQTKSTVVKFPSGYAIFTVDPIERYPLKKIAKFVNRTAKGSTMLFNMAVVADALEKLAPIFIGEKQPVLTISNADTTMFTAESIVNGISVVEYEGAQSNVQFELDIDPRQFRSIPISFNVYYNEEFNDRLYLAEDNIDLVILGERQ